MTEQREFDLLVDISKLLRKYGADVFEKLARVLSTPESSERLAAILSATVKQARPIENGARDAPMNSGRNIRAALADIANADPGKSTLLTGLYEDLRAKRFLPTLRDFRAYAASNGLPPIQATKRNKAVEYLIDALIPLPRDRVEALAGRLRADANHDDRSLAGWTRIILDKENPDKEAAP